MYVLQWLARGGITQTSKRIKQMLLVFILTFSRLSALHLRMLYFIYVRHGVVVCYFLPLQACRLGRDFSIDSPVGMFSCSFVHI